MALSSTSLRNDGSAHRVAGAGDWGYVKERDNLFLLAVSGRLRPRIGDVGNQIAPETVDMDRAVPNRSAIETLCNRHRLDELSTAPVPRFYCALWLFATDVPDSNNDWEKLSVPKSQLPIAHPTSHTPSCPGTHRMRRGRRGLRLFLYAPTAK